MAIDFNQDIAPLKQQFFPMLTGAKTFDRNMAYQQQVLNPIKDRIAKKQSDSMQLRRQELAYKSQKLAFREARDKVRMDREGVEAMPLITARLDEIQNSGGSAAEQRDAFNRLAVENIGLITKNQLAGNLFRMQEKRLNDRLADRAKAEQKEQGVRNIYANSYLQKSIAFGESSPETYRGILDGTVSLEDANAALIGMEKKAATRKAQAEAYETQTKATKDRKLGVVTAALKFLDGVKLNEDENDPSVPKSLKLEDRRRIADDMLRIQGIQQPTQEERDSILGPIGTEVDFYHIARGFFEDEASKLATGGGPAFISEADQKQIDDINAAFPQ